MKYWIVSAKKDRQFFLKVSSTHPFWAWNKRFYVSVIRPDLVPHAEDRMMVFSSLNQVREFAATIRGVSASSIAIERYRI